MIDLSSIKSIDLASFCTERLGMKVIQDTGGRVYFYSPFRSEGNPSFTVSRRTNRWKDWGEDNTSAKSHGTIIDLVMAIENVDFKVALQRIAGDYRIDSPPRFEALEEKEELPGIMVMSSGKIKDRKLVAYIEGRKIDIDLCRKYCEELEVRFPYSKSDPDRKHKVIGFKNDSGGYEIRNGFLKLSTRPKTIRTIQGEIGDEWMVFEGFFDFMSALTYFGVETFARKAIILNTTSFLGGLYPMMADNKMNWMYLDNDTTGKNRIGEMEVYGLPYRDCSYLYDGFKDFNEMITSEKKV